MFWFSIFFIVSISSQIFCDEDNKVVHLTSEDFETSIESNNYFVEFFAPWCGHCKRLAPTWQELAKLKNHEDSKIVIADVDCTSQSDLCSEQKVTGYPTIILYKVGSEGPIKFTGSRTKESLEEFIDEHVGGETKEAETPEAPPQVALIDLTEETFKDHISANYRFVEFYAPWCSHCKKLAPVWEQLAETMKNIESLKISRIDCTKYRKICQENDVKSYPALLLFKDGERVEKYSGERNHDDLQEYIEKIVGIAGDVKTTADVSLLNEENFHDTVAKGVTFVEFFAPWCGHCKELAPTWQELANKYHTEQDGIVIAKVDCTENQDLCVEQEVQGYPTIFLYKDNEKQPEYNGGRELDELVSYLEIELKDSTPVTKYSTLDVDILSEENFQDFIASNDATFIEFYAPWCGHCKDLEPTWIELAKKMHKEKKGLRIAKVDCTENQHLCIEQDVKGYPQIFLYKKTEKQEKYGGQRSLEELVSYLNVELGIHTELDVLVLDPDNFKDTIANGLTFVKFYAPWCPHSTKLAPTWVELAQKVHSEIKEVKIAQVDCIKYKSFCEENNVTAIPKMYMYKDSEQLNEYIGSRDLDQFLFYIDSEININSDSDVDRLTDKNFNEKIANGIIFVEFFASWCGHCKNLEPTWKELANKVHKEYEDQGVRIAKIDCTKYADICAEHDITGYPSLYMFINSEKQQKYSGGRSLEDLFSHVSKSLGTVNQKDVLVLNQDNFQETIATDVTFVKFYAPWCGHCKDLAPTWTELANKVHTEKEGVRIAKIDCTVNRDICSEQEVSGYPTLYLYKNSEKVDEYSGGRNLDGLISFIDASLSSHDEL